MSEGGWRLLGCPPQWVGCVTELLSYPLSR